MYKSSPTFSPVALTVLAKEEAPTMKMLRSILAFCELHVAAEGGIPNVKIAADFAVPQGHVVVEKGTRHLQVVADHGSSQVDPALKRNVVQ
jgi:hypothetical protein